MATKIRLKRLGKIRTPHYRVVVIDSRTKRDGRPIEEIGQYHPKADPSIIQIDSERAQYWLGVGAQPTEAVVALLKRTGDWQKHTGDKSPSGIDEQKPRKDKAAIFNAALAEADGEPTVSATTASRRGKKAVAAADAITEALSDKPAAETIEGDAAVSEAAPVEAAAEAVETKAEAVETKVEAADEPVADAAAAEVAEQAAAEETVAAAAAEAEEKVAEAAADAETAGEAEAAAAAETLEA